MTKYIYQSAGVNAIIYGADNNADHTFRVAVDRSFVDSAQDVRFYKRSFSEFEPIWITKPGCNDGCLTKRSTRAIATKINSPTPKDQAEKGALIASVKEHFNNVLKALDEYNVSSGSLPPSSATFDGTYVTA